MLGRHSIRRPPFVLNLREILSEPNYSHMIAWERSGTSFIIKNSVEFASKVLPQYYETNKLASFTRQLNIYGFERVSDRRRARQAVASSSIIYSHQYFKRDQPDSLHLIQRISGPYCKVRTTASIIGESQDIKPTLLSSKLLSVLSSTPRDNSHPVFQEKCEAMFTKDIAVDCLSCTALTCEVETLRRKIEYYKFLIENPVNYMDILTNDQEACTVDISQSLIPSFAVPASLEDGLLGLWANYDPNLYSYIRPYPSPMDDVLWFPRNDSN